MTRQRFDKTLPIIIAVMGAIAMLLAFPYLISAYHLEAGGRAAHPSATQGHLNQALRWNPSNAQAYRLLGQAYLEQGNWRSAVEVLSRYTNLRPGNPLGHIELAEAYEVLQAEVGADALPHLDARIATEWHSAGLSVDMMLDQGEAARHAGRWDEARAWFGRALLLEPVVGDPWYYYGLLYESQEEWSRALDSYMESIALGNSDRVGASATKCRMASIYWRQPSLRQPDEALALYERALATNDFGTVEDAANCHYSYGFALRERGVAPLERIDEFQLATELNPNHIWAHIMLGLDTHEYLEDTAAAETEFLIAVDLAPDNPAPLFYLGDLYEKEGRKGEARQAFERTLEVDPSFEKARRRLDALIED